MPVKDLVSLDITFHVTVPVDCALTEPELKGLLTGEIESTELLTAKKVEALCNSVDFAICDAWYRDGRKFVGADIQVTNVEEQEVP